MTGIHVFLLAMLIIGAVIALLSFFGQKELNRQSWLKLHGHLAQATVIGSKRYVSDDGAYFCPILQFETITGEVAEVVDRNSSHSEFVTGTAIRLRYDRNNPNNFLVISADSYQRVQKKPWYFS